MTDLTGSEQGELIRDMSERASTLYWHSDRSVNSIADDLGLSKGRLYDLIKPLGSGLDCPNCQSELVFTNRTAHERDEAICPVCDLGGAPVEAVRPAGGVASRAPSSGPVAAKPTTNGQEGSSATEVELEDLEPLSPETKGLVAGLLVGGVAGVLLGRYLLR